MSQIENKDKGMEMFIGSLTMDLVRLGQCNKVKRWDIPEILPHFPPQHSGLPYTCLLSYKAIMASKVIINIGAYNLDAMKALPLQLTIQDLVNSNNIVLDCSQVLHCCILAEIVKKKAGTVSTNQLMLLGYEYLAFPYINKTTGHWKVPSKIIKINDLLPIVSMQKKFDKQQAKGIQAINYAFHSVQPLKTGLCSYAGPSHLSPIPVPSLLTTTSSSTTPSISSIHKPTLSATTKPFMPQSMAPDVAKSLSALSSSNLAGLKFHKKDGDPKGLKGTEQAMDVDDPEEDSLLNYKDNA
ncbi:hypothetical protein EDD85DRAFT_792110 [Armillaria nabsnona]|nr:hypothetical protein EDD85DRAFT_792110 [Armillaria nabsnona]